MLILGIESSCDETGVALYTTEEGGRLLCHALHSQIVMHQAYGGVVPELASRDHIRRTVPLLRKVLTDSGRSLEEVDAIAYTQGPGLAGALLVGAEYGLGTAVVGLIALAVFFGHLYPVFLKFKGGKGVATAAGVAPAWGITMRDFTKPRYPTYTK